MADNFVSCNLHRWLRDWKLRDWDSSVGRLLQSSMLCVAAAAVALAAAALAVATAVAVTAA